LVSLEELPNVDGKDGKNYKNNSYFNNAINKYGWNNIKHEILFTGLTKEEAEQLEIDLIAQYKSNNSKYGYNIENGGNSTGKLSEETKMKISLANKGRHFIGRKHTEEEKQRVSNKLKGRVSPMKDKHWTIEQRANVGTAIICVNTGEKFYSIREAARVTGCDRSNISRVLKGVYRTTRGLAFEYGRK
jgi:group I intron endonuclease